MELAFSSTSLRELCEDEGTMVKRLGHENAHALKTLLADLRASSKASELEDVHRITLSPDGCLTSPIANGDVLIAKANHLNNPKGVDGRIDWSAVNRLKIEAVGEHR